MSDIVYEPVMSPGLPLSFWETVIHTKIQKENWHDNIELVFAVRGEGFVKCDSKNIPIKTDEFCVINSNCVHCAEGLPKGLYFYNIEISNDFCNYNGIDIQNYIFDEKFSDDYLKEKLFLLYDLHKNTDDPLHYAQICSILLDFLLHLIRNHAYKNENKYSAHDTNIMLAMGYIKSHIHEKISLDTIALQVGLSKYHLERKFKEKTGYSIIDYINILRCDNACRYLKQNTYTVHDVFQMTCFSNYSYFSKMFKKHKGVSPSEYKKLYSDKKIEDIKY